MVNSSALKFLGHEETSDTRADDDNLERVVPHGIRCVPVDYAFVRHSLFLQIGSHKTMGIA